MRGTWKDIASAAFKVKQLKVELLKFAVKEVAKECCSLCSSKNPSLLRKCGVDNIANLSLEKICQEFKERAPLLYCVLMTAGIPANSIKKDLDWLPSVAAAGAILMNERCRVMNAFQILFMLCIKHTGIKAMSSIMSSLKVGVTSTYYNKKCDEYGCMFDCNIRKVKQEDEVIISQNAKAATDDESPCCDLENNESSLSSGNTFSFDNFDIYQKVCNMTEDNQNKDIHWVNHNAIKNRVSGNHLPDDVPMCDMAELNNDKLLPNCMDHVMQKSDYVVLMERIITEELPCLSFCRDVVTKHIAHPHSKEMAEKTEKVCTLCNSFSIGLILLHTNMTACA